ncbi:hypothetical protein SCG7086_AD_00420 [Chlamydiales bacterium SCGC AG-110-P3]|nr:hypothetical protein SCG7086_AD_00420 [Chlamydiales bacterium SCGC AG-110-P3]
MFFPGPDPSPWRDSVSKDDSLDVNTLDAVRDEVVTSWLYGSVVSWSSARSVLSCRVDSLFHYLLGNPQHGRFVPDDFDCSAWR